MDLYNIIDISFKPGSNFSIGNFNVIMEDVFAGDNVSIESHCQIKPYTYIGSGCIIETGCKFSGGCVLRNRVHLKQNVIVGRNVEIGDGTFISPNVVFLFADHKLETGYQKTIVGNNVFIGSGCQIMPGVVISDGAVIGAGSVVTKDCEEENGIYVGSPAEFMRYK